jgi:hypothetical protein
MGSLLGVSESASAEFSFFTPGNKRMHGAHFHGNEYDDATMKALIAHFKTFTAQEKR